MAVMRSVRRPVRRPFGEGMRERRGSPPQETLRGQVRWMRTNLRMGGEGGRADEPRGDGAFLDSQARGGIQYGSTIWDAVCMRCGASRGAAQRPVPDLPRSASRGASRPCVEARPEGADWRALGTPAGYYKFCIILTCPGRHHRIDS